MPLAPPLGTNYPSPLMPLPSDSQRQPQEGRMQIPVEVLWNIMGGANKAITFNLNENQTSDITQISALVIDNSKSAAPIVFVFPDTGENINVAAGVKRAVIPVYTSAMNFTLSAPTAIATDETRFIILNYPAMPFLMA